MTKGRRIALVVGIGRYDDRGLRALRAPSHDVDALARVLSDTDVGDFEVTSLIDCSAQELREAIDALYADAVPDDLLVLHLSCHGLKNADGELHFAASDTKVARPASTGIAASWVTSQMARSRSRQGVLILDCCFSGAFDRGMHTRGDESVDMQEQFRPLAGRGRAVITASTSLEYAFEGAELQGDLNAAGTSVFTTALADGLRTGAADRDLDGLVSLDELYDYVFARVRDTTRNQTPTKTTYGLQGALYIAKRAGGIPPKPLPDELLAALEHPLSSVRRGIIPDLLALAEGSDPGVVVAARRALEKLRDDDSRSVADAARNAILSVSTTVTTPDEPPPIVRAHAREQPSTGKPENKRTSTDIMSNQVPPPRGSNQVPPSRARWPVISRPARLIVVACAVVMVLYGWGKAIWFGHGATRASVQRLLNGIHSCHRPDLIPSGADYFTAVGIAITIPVLILIFLGVALPTVRFRQSQIPMTFVGILVALTALVASISCAVSVSSTDVAAYRNSCEPGYKIDPAGDANLNSLGPGIWLTGTAYIIMVLALLPDAIAVWRTYRANVP